MTSVLRWIAATFVFMASAPALAVATPSKIRVGGPSSPSEPKIAIVGSDKSLKGDRFEVVDSGDAVVLESKLTKAPGKPAPWKRAYAADLSEITEPGSGRVKLADEIVEIERLDTIPGPDGLEMIAFGARHENDGEIDPNWWTE